ncbi:MAG: 30S ribosomal protein S6 [Planctomycetota bacterium]
METATKRLYEGMFLLDSGLAAQDWQVVLDEIQRVMDRAGAEVVSQKKWDDRRLAYDLRRSTRGTYILVYFNCETDRVKNIERDVQLSEILLRVMILRTDRMSTEDLEKATPLEAQAKEAEEAEKAKQERMAAAAARAEEAAKEKASDEAAAENVVAEEEASTEESA